MTILFQGPQTPTDARIRKLSNGGYLLEMVLHNPDAEQPCHRHGVKGEVHATLADAMLSLNAYLEKGKGCFCDDCDHAHHTG